MSLFRYPFGDAFGLVRGCSRKWFDHKRSDVVGYEAREKKKKEEERGTSSLRGINRGDIITEINAALSFWWQPKLPTVLAFISRTIIWSCFSIPSFFYPFHLRKVIWGREGTVLNFTYPWELDLLVALLAPRATNSVFFLPIISAKRSNEENVSSLELPFFE